ncbi:hypothetical protein HY061_02170 [Candidatus Azambacteria bacterium]|nr:hypothetical protein [Candidatus Azambacteria bacterium]
MSTRYPKQFSSPKKVKKHHRLKLGLFILGILILGIIFLIWYLPKKEILNDREIIFIGPDKFIESVKLKVNDFISQDYFFYKNNLLINSKNLNDYLINNFLEIDSIDIEKNFLKKKLTIKISAREGIGIFCSSPIIKESDASATSQKSINLESKIQNSKSPLCYWFDKNAFLFKETPELIGALVLRITDERGEEFKLKSKPFDKKMVNVFINFKDLIKKYVNFEINDFLITPELYPDLLARTTLGFDIKFESERYEEALIKFREIIDKKIPEINLQKIKYFDLRTKDRLYYK